MVCPRLDNCGFFQKYQNVIGEQRYDNLVRSYCKGPFQPMCKRLKYVAQVGEDPSPDLRPDGCRAGTNEKIYT